MCIFASGAEEPNQSQSITYEHNLCAVLKYAYSYIKFCYKMQVRSEIARYIVSIKSSCHLECNAEIAWRYVLLDWGSTWQNAAFDTKIHNCFLQHTAHQNKHTVLLHQPTKAMQKHYTSMVWVIKHLMHYQFVLEGIFAYLHVVPSCRFPHAIQWLWARVGAEEWSLQDSRAGPRSNQDPCVS